jgi:hypothetical protein
MALVYVAVEEHAFREETLLEKVTILEVIMSG